MLVRQHKRDTEICLAGCWITKDFSKQRIALEYFWLWLAAFGNIIIYASLFLVVKGDSYVLVLSYHYDHV